MSFTTSTHDTPVPDVEDLHALIKGTQASREDRQRAANEAVGAPAGHVPVDGAQKGTRAQILGHLAYRCTYFGRMELHRQHPAMRDQAVWLGSIGIVPDEVYEVAAQLVERGAPIMLPSVRATAWPTNWPLTQSAPLTPASEYVQRTTSPPDDRAPKPLWMSASDVGEDFRRSILALSPF